MPFNTRLNPPIVLPALGAALLLALPGCLQTNASRDLGAFLGTESREEEPNEAPSVDARPVAAIGDASSASPSARTMPPAEASAGGSPTAASMFAERGQLAGADPRLTPEQRSLLLAQLEALSRPISDRTEPTIVDGEAAPQSTRKLADVNAPTGLTDSDQVQENAAPETAAAAGSEVSSSGPPATAAGESSSTPAESSSASAAPASTAPRQNADASAADSSAVAAASAVEATTGNAASSKSASAEETAPAAESVVASSNAAPETTAPEGTAPDASAAAAEPSPQPSAADLAEPSAALPWDEHLQQSIAALERKLQDSEIEPTERLRLEGTLRLLHVASGQREPAVEPIEMADEHHQEFWKQAAYGLLELLAPDGPPIASRRAKMALRSLREAIQQLAAISSLDVRSLAICRRVESFGQYTEFDPYEFTAGQEVILYVELNNFMADRTEQGYETEFQGSYQILDAQGRRLMDYDLLLDKQVCRNLRTDYFLPYRIYLPDSLTAGSYKLQVTVEDKKGKKFGQTPPVDLTIVP